MSGYAIKPTTIYATTKKLVKKPESTALKKRKAEFANKKIIFTKDGAIEIK